ncbi:hypothetical protein [Xanthomonas campestris]|uniref:hypothetical protein n=1 Tax=Xanthomonas campestris TaxID=339 RepID=UPI0011C46CBD|nr:hypothetical protein [Xanthomonas campestris]WDI95629.1 hypothetical protein JH280_10580 [Xanthomonas campestris]
MKITLSRDRHQREVLIQPLGFCSEACIPLSQDTMRHFLRETKRAAYPIGGLGGRGRLIGVPDFVYEISSDFISFAPLGIGALT